MPKLRSLCLVLAVLCSLLPSLYAQSVDQFRAAFLKGFDAKDDFTMDKAVKGDALMALTYYEEIAILKFDGDAAAGEKAAALAAAWKRVFEGGETVERVDRWISAADNQTRQAIQKCRSDAVKLWAAYEEMKAKPTREGVSQLAEQFRQVAGNAARIGHSIQVAEMWNFSAIVLGLMPERTLDDRREALAAVDEFLRARKEWGFVLDPHYLRNADFAKSERTRIEEAGKQAEKRKGEGYAADAKGIDAMVKAGVPEVKQALKFEALANLDEPDYGPRNGPVPAFWWMISLTKEGTLQKFDWFRRSNLFLARTGATKFGVSLQGDKIGEVVEVDVSPKAKIATFHLDADQKQPYAMAFWIGSDRELVNEAQCNLTVSPEVANIYYRSAASWKATIGADAIVLYDDDVDGTPADTDPFAVPWKAGLLGDAKDPKPVPLIDSMRIGKGPRVPYSEFVKLSTGWHHMRANLDGVGVRPLNPDYFKTGKVKLVWNGPKPSAPSQLVIRGSGDFQTAFFDVAGGKEVEVPAGQYSILLGRIVVGKAPRVQLATLFGGESETFTVEAGKTKELKLGAPFTLSFTREGDDPATIDALSIVLKDAAGCVLTQWHGLNLACEVLASKDADGKGAKSVGKFVPFTDPELVNKASAANNNLLLWTACFPMPDGYKTGPQVLQVDLPSPGMKLQLVVKKHAWFGALHSLWK